jgi:hypothetical protein
MLEIQVHRGDRVDLKPGIQVHQDDRAGRMLEIQVHLEDREDLTLGTQVHREDKAAPMQEMQAGRVAMVDRELQGATEDLAEISNDQYDHSKASSILTSSKLLPVSKATNIITGSTTDSNAVATVVHTAHLQQELHTTKVAYAATKPAGSLDKTSSTHTRPETLNADSKQVRSKSRLPSETALQTG